jgi:phage terminase small subunit
MAKGLTPREAKFAVELAKGKTQTEAALKAGYSKKSARFQGSRIATKRNVRRRVKQVVSKAFAAAEVTEERIIERLAKWGLKGKRDFVGLGSVQTLAKIKGMTNHPINMNVKQKVTAIRLIEETVDKPDEHDG